MSATAMISVRDSRSLERSLIWKYTFANHQWQRVEDKRMRTRASNKAVKKKRMEPKTEPLEASLCGM